jgi:membrane fusion protein (multidrug efflux system)
MLAAKADVDRVEGEYRRYEDLHRRGLVSKAMYDNLKYDLDALRATHKLRALEYGYATIRAPIAGIVSSRSIRPGEHLKLNQEAFRITETRELLADLQVPQTELRRIATGQTAKLTVDALPGREFPAEIVRLSPTIDVRSGTFRATARIDNASGDLAPGMFARFSIAYEMHPDALVIPKSALIEEDEETAVYVVVGDAVEKRVIGTGIQAGGRVEVLEGLGESDQVVVNGQGALRDGSKVLAQLGDDWPRPDDDTKTADDPIGSEPRWSRSAHGQFGTDAAAPGRGSDRYPLPESGSRRTPGDSGDGCQCGRHRPRYDSGSRLRSGAYGRASALGTRGHQRRQCRHRAERS